VSDIGSSTAIWKLFWNGSIQRFDHIQSIQMIDARNLALALNTNLIESGLSPIKYSLR
jgi:hypothetical protein